MGQESRTSRLQKWTEFNAAVVSTFVQYQVPTIELIKSTPKEAVCQVFEKVNTGGVPLTVFELLTATYAVDDFNLATTGTAKQEGKDRRHHRPLPGPAVHVGGHRGYGVLPRSVAALQLRLPEGGYRGVGEDGQTDHRRQRSRTASRSLCSSSPLAGVSAPRGIPHRRFLEGGEVVSEGVILFKTRDLPYRTQLVPMAAVFGPSWRPVVGARRYTTSFRGGSGAACSANCTPARRRRGSPKTSRSSSPGWTVKIRRTPCGKRASTPSDSMTCVPGTARPIRASTRC